MNRLRNLLLAGLLLLLSTPSFAIVQSTYMRDANLTVPPAAYAISTLNTFSATRTLTLPQAGATQIGQSGASTYYQNSIVFYDTAQAINGANILSIAPASGDLINGSASPLSVDTAGSVVVLTPTSSNNWIAAISKPGSAVVPATTCAANQWVSAIAVTGAGTCSATGTVVASGKVATFSNTLTFTGTDASSIAFGTGGTIGAVGYSATGQVQGTATNDAAAAGKVGEYIEALQSSATNFPATGTYGDLGSLALTAGDWDVSYMLTAQNNGATTSQFLAGIGTAAGNAATGLLPGINQANQGPPSVSADASVAIPSYRISIAAPTTYYCKVLASFSAGNPRYVGRCSARRPR